MGMFNEVFDVCPECGKAAGYAQVRQVALGFGGFDLSDWAGLRSRIEGGDLSRREALDLADEIEDSSVWFRCGAAGRSGSEDGDSEGCGASWRIDPAKALALRMLCEESPSEVREKAVALLRAAGVQGF